MPDPLDEGFKPALAALNAAPAGQPGGRVKDEIARLLELCRELPEGAVRPDRLKNMHRIAQDVRTLSGAAGRPLLADVAGSLCMLLGRLMADGERARLTPLRKAAIAMHVRKLSHTESQPRAASDEAGGRLIAGLRAVAEKASA